MTVFWRYWLLQVPGWAVLVALLVGAHHWLELSLSGCGVVFAGWIVKDVLLYPILKPHYELKEHDPQGSLRGATAVSEERLEPRGYVKLRGELWMAELSDGEASVSRGETVRVESVEGLILKVRLKVRR